MKNGDRICKRLLLISLVVPWPATIALGQSQSDATQSSQSSQQSQSQAQSQLQQKEDSVAEAARKAKAKKAKPEPAKVFTEEDLSGMRGNGVSVVGDDAPAGAGAAGTKKAEGKTGGKVTPMSGQDEAYWRGKARELLDEMAAIDQEIAKTKDGIKKYGSDGFDATTGLKDNIIYIDNRTSKVQQLEKRKADLGKKLDQLQEEGRKAGASPAWFR
jgi:hypothetical protein